MHAQYSAHRDSAPDLISAAAPSAKLDYYGAWRAAQGLAGDFLDHLELPDGSVGIAIGECAGKGRSFGLLATALYSMVRGLALPPPYMLAASVGKLNDLLMRASHEHGYATLFLARYDPRQNTLRYVNAGHEPAILLRRSGRRGQIIELAANGPSIGTAERVLYREQTVALQPGDLLVAYTDGLCDTSNPAGQTWGKRRLLDAIEACRDQNAHAIVTHTMTSIDRFAGAEPRHDDMTLWVGRVPQSAALQPAELEASVDLLAAYAVGAA
jgi:sigma-B regulation protein RsbU (phosphoserine phosphatase)